ncbi:hypothetical protein AHAS_Ahas11G0121900 [Arachis hypogaea]
MEALLNDILRDVAHVDGIKESINEDVKKFYSLVKEACKEQYFGFKEFFTLSFTIQLYFLKYHYRWSNASLTSLMELLNETIHNLNIPSSYNKAKDYGERLRS